MTLWKELALDVLARAPQNLISRAMGRVSRWRYPRPLAKVSVRAFAQAMHIDVGEAELPLADYSSVHDFFVRRLRAGARRIDPRPGFLSSPCDGVLGAEGQIEDGTLVQAKGRDYSVEALLRDGERAKAFAGGTYVTIYLSPRHYHRVHSPLAASVERVDHIPGQLLPVNHTSVNHFDGVFVRNERLVVWLQSKNVSCALVMVGATCVGEISLAFDATMVSNRAKAKVARKRYADVRLQKGEELGTFHLGSTVVLLCPGKHRVLQETGSEVRLGEALLKLGATAN